MTTLASAKGLISLGCFGPYIESTGRAFILGGGLFLMGVIGPLLSLSLILHCPSERE